MKGETVLLALLVGGAFFLFGETKRKKDCKCTEKITLGDAFKKATGAQVDFTIDGPAPSGNEMVAMVDSYFSKGKG